jgi:TatD DNase family protein
MYIDTHAHLNDEAYIEDLEAVVKHCQDNQLRYVLNIGYDMPSTYKAVELAKAYDFCYAGVGVHPHDAETVTEETYTILKQLAQEKKVIAIGEIGLDYYRNLSPKDKQINVFRRQIALAKAMKLPIIIHDRDSHEDIMQIMKEEKAEEVGGVLHCFSGSWEMAKVCLNMGFYISFAGPVTFNNANKLREVAKKVPKDRILGETDCPYLTPVPYRGQRNEPSYVIHVVKKLAELRAVTETEMAHTIMRNAQTLFNLK